MIVYNDCELLRIAVLKLASIVTYQLAIVYSSIHYPELITIIQTIRGDSTSYGRLIPSMAAIANLLAWRCQTSDRFCSICKSRAGLLGRPKAAKLHAILSLICGNVHYM